MNNQSTVADPSRPVPTFVSAKISEEHLQLGAALYVRQSSFTQLREHQESTARQYALKDRLVAFGWPDDRVIVIDDDLGISGSGSAERPGFRRLLKLVTDQQVGIVLGLEMSRLARNSKDWQDLFEVCAIFQTLIADEDGVFDPQDPNDRLVLGLKGIIAEMELHTMKVRLERGRLNKARRGELFHDVPVGYVLDEQDLPQLDPDESARHVMTMFFHLFESLGSSHALFHHLAEHNIRLPFRQDRRDRSSSIDWRLAAKTTVYELLKHPLYAGAYGYARRKRYRQKGGKKQGKKYLPPVGDPAFGTPFSAARIPTPRSALPDCWLCELTLSDELESDVGAAETKPTPHRASNQGLLPICFRRFLPASPCVARSAFARS